MNNKKRRFLSGVIAAVVCFTMVIGSFGAIIGAALGILSNEDLINAINNGSIAVGDLALLASLNSSNYVINGQGVTNVSEDGYHAKNNPDEADDKEADYNTYNKPYYTAGVTSTSTTATIGGTEYTVKYAPTSAYFGAQGQDDSLEKAGVSGNLLIYCDISMRHGAYAGTGNKSVINVAANANLVIALATAAEILSETEDLDRIRLNRTVFADDTLNQGIAIGGAITDISSETVYGVCINRCYFNLAAGASLTLLGRDFNNNGYIDDIPVQVNVGGTNYWFYEKIVLSGSSAYQGYKVLDNGTMADNVNGGREVLNAKAGTDIPLIAAYGGTTSGTTCKLILSGADLRNNFNKKIPELVGIGDGYYATHDDVMAGGGAIYLASGSAHGLGRNETTCGYFAEVTITGTRFSYCGAVRGGAIMVGKNFYSSTLDISYCDFNHCYTAYFNYGGVSNDHKRGDQSGDGGAICFYQDDSLTEDDNWFGSKDHNNPSLIWVGTADFTGSDFRFCYAMRAGGAIHFGGYFYDNEDLVEDSNGYKTENYTLDPEYLGTRIEKLLLDFCDFYCCGAGWAMYDAPEISDSDFIYTSNYTQEITDDNPFYGLMASLGITDIPANADVDGSEGHNHNYKTLSTYKPQYYLFEEAHFYSSQNLSSFQWYRGYDSFNSDATLYNNSTSKRRLHNWYNIPQLKFAEGSREGGAIFFNCRVKEMSMKDCTFTYCATDSNGSAVFLADYFVCPKAIVENCLFKNCLSTQSYNGGGTEGGTFRSRGLVAADIHFNNCSFLYNSNMAGAGALYMNLNNTYTGPNDYDEYNVKAPDNENADGTAKRNGDACAGTEVNNCVFFGNFAFWRGAAIKCTGVMDINSSTFAYNMTNGGSGGAIKLETYNRNGVVVGSSKAHMRFDIDYGITDTAASDYFDGHTIVCYNAVGGNSGGNGGGGISIYLNHSESVGVADTIITAGGYESRKYTFDVQLNGVLVFNNTAVSGGGGLLFRVNNDNAGSADIANAHLYHKSLDLNEGYVFNNIAYNNSAGGGGVRVRDKSSLVPGSTEISMSGAHIYANDADKYAGGGIYIIAQDADVSITGGSVLANTAATDGAGIYIKNTRQVSITGGQIGATLYGAPTFVPGDKTTATSFNKAASATLQGGNIAPNNGGGIYICNELTTNTDVTMNGGIVEANSATLGGGVYMVRPEDNTTYGYVHFTMNPADEGEAYGFYGNTAATNGAGIFISSGNVITEGRYVVNLNGGEMVANEASGSGGALFVTAGASVNVDGAILDSNKASGTAAGTYGDGGAIYINVAASQATLSGGTLSGNSASRYGGGIHADEAEINVRGNVVVHENTADTAGGGLAIRGAALTMNGGTVSANEAPIGAGVYLSSNTEGVCKAASITNGVITANVASENGGGVYADAGISLTLGGGTISENKAVDGAGLYVANRDTVANISGGTIGTGNKASNNGGGICVTNYATVNMTDGNVVGNTATNDGAGICVIEGATLNIDGGSVQENTSTGGNGGGICVTPSDGTVRVVPQDGITTLNVAVWVHTSGVDDYGGSTEATKTMGDTKAANLVSGFEAFLISLGYDMNEIVLNYKYYDNNDDGYNNQTAIEKMVSDFASTGLDIIIGGGPNIYSSHITNYATDYDLCESTLLTNSGASLNMTHFGISSSYQTCTNRTVALMTKTGNDDQTLEYYLSNGVSHLAELFYRFVVASSTYSATDKSTVELSYDYLMPTTTTTAVGGSTATINGGTVSNNVAQLNGGGICVTGDSVFTMNGGSIRGNTSNAGNGGGVYTDSVVSGYKVPSDGVTTLKVIAFTNQPGNTAVNGTKVLPEETVVAIENQFKKYLEDSKYSIGTGEGQINVVVDRHTASVNIANTSTLLKTTYKSYDIVIGVGANAINGNNNGSGNTSPNYSTRALMSNTYIHGNRYIAVINSTKSELINAFYNMVTTGSIAADTTPAPASDDAVILSAGNISGNKALSGNGGGVCCDGSVVSLDAPDNASYPVINANSAKNGGGVAVINGGEVTMEGGYITGNNAIGTSTFTSNVTTYLQSTHNGGVGGGIYVANPYGNTKGVASFSIVNYDTINSGIYLNNAEFAADDLYANAVDTMISVPDFNSMKIIDDAGEVTGWFEDYATGEANYTEGLNGINGQDAEPLRYDYAVTHSQSLFQAWISAEDKAATPGETTSNPVSYINVNNEFVCVTLGAYVVYDGKLTITKSIPDAADFDPEQAFIFHVVRTHDASGTAVEAGSADAIDLYVTINVTDADTRKASVTLTSLPIGTYEVTELTEWSWRYSVTNTTVVDKAGNTKPDANAALEIVSTTLETSTAGTDDPVITFANAISNDSWLDGNGPKAVNTLGSGGEIVITWIGGTNTANVAYVNFKREETLI